MAGLALRLAPAGAPVDRWASNSACNANRSGPTFRLPRGARSAPGFASDDPDTGCIPFTRCSGGCAITHGTPTMASKKAVQARLRQDRKSNMGLLLARVAAE